MALISLLLPRPALFLSFFIARRVALGPWGWPRCNSFSQVVPHEALGMASFTKNLFIGAAGADTINFTHHICAVRGVENVMGRWADNPGE